MDALFDEDAGPVDYQMETDILDDEEITQEDAWVVIDKYFLERGLSFLLHTLMISIIHNKQNITRCVFVVRMCCALIVWSTLRTMLPEEYFHPRRSWSLRCVKKEFSMRIKNDVTADKIFDLRSPSSSDLLIQHINWLSLYCSLNALRT